MCRASVQTFVEGCCSLNQDPTKFKMCLKDWLIIIRAIEPDVEEAREEAELQKEAKAEEERQKAAAIPGLLKPSEMAGDEEL